MKNAYLKIVFTFKFYLSTIQKKQKYIVNK